MSRRSGRAPKPRDPGLFVSQAQSSFVSLGEESEEEHEEIAQDEVVGSDSSPSSSEDEATDQSDEGGVTKSRKPVASDKKHAQKCKGGKRREGKEGKDEVRKRGKQLSKAGQSNWRYLPSTTPLKVQINTSHADVIGIRQEVEAVITKLALHHKRDVVQLQQLSILDLIMPFLDPLVAEFLSFSPNVTKDMFYRFQVCSFVVGCACVIFILFPVASLSLHAPLSCPLYSYICVGFSRRYGIL